MNARRIYRWDDPWETGMWLGGYIFFWIFGQLAAAAVGLLYLALSLTVHLQTVH